MVPGYHGKRFVSLGGTRLNIKFWKVQAAGNDFVLVHNEDVVGVDLPELARNVSERGFSVGSDGLLVVTPTNEGLHLRMFNPDGSEDFCGNGTRCAAMHAHQLGLVGSHFTIDHLGRKVPAEILRGGMVRVTLPPATVVPDQVPYVQPNPSQEKITVEGVEGSPISTGSTHFIVFRNYAVPDSEFLAKSPLVEVSPVFPERTSIMWTRVLEPGQISLRIWERGAGETLGCGTGSCAAAAIYLREYGFEGEVAVQNPGGTIYVTILPDGQIQMSSVPSAVYEGTVEVEVATITSAAR